MKQIFGKAGPGSRFPSYRVHYREFRHDIVKASANGPWDYLGNARKDRDKLFQRPDIHLCWIENRGVPIGKVLVKTSWEVENIIPASAGDPGGTVSRS